MKPEDFHIYKERALTGNRWLAMDEGAMIAELERWQKSHENDLYYSLSLIRTFTEQLKKDIPFEKIYMVPTRQSGRSIAHAELLTMAELLKVKGE